MITCGDGGTQRVKIIRNLAQRTLPRDIAYISFTTMIGSGHSRARREGDHGIKKGGESGRALMWSASAEKEAVRSMRNANLRVRLPTEGREEKNEENWGRKCFSSKGVLVLSSDSSGNRR